MSAGGSVDRPRMRVLVFTDPSARARLEAMFASGYAVTRAVQSDARHRTRAYWAAPHERAADPAAARDRLGLSRTGLEHAAYAHVDAAPHLRRSRLWHSSRLCAGRRLLIPGSRPIQ